MKRYFWFSLIFAGIGFAQAQTNPTESAQSLEMDRFFNSKFIYAVKYPKKLLLSQGETQSGEGQTFESKDKKLKLLVWAERKSGPTKLAADCEQKIKSEQAQHPFTPTYKVVKDGWYAFSLLSKTVGNSLFWTR